MSCPREEVPYEKLSWSERGLNRMDHRRAPVTSAIVLVTLASVAVYCVVWMWCLTPALAGFYGSSIREDAMGVPPEMASLPYAAPDAAGFKLVCYYSLPTQHDNHGLDPEEVDASLCTHIIMAFAKVAINNSLTPMGGPRDREDYKRVVNLRNRNPKLKVLLSVAGEMKSMVANHTTRKTFIRSCLTTLKLYKLDGIDLDWEFPSDALKFTELLAEMRDAFRNSYLLTVAVAAPEQIADISYKINIMARFVDWINLMTYDFYAYNKLTPFTGFNSPLYAGRDEAGLLAHLNTNWSAHHWESQGMPRRNIVVGIPTYCHTFTLVNEHNHGIGAPARGGGSASYPYACQFIWDGAAVVEDRYTKSPYAFKEDTWVSFENKRSVSHKAEFVVTGKYAGAMIWSLNNDDFLGSCYNSSIKFPLSRRIYSVLKGLPHVTRHATTQERKK